MGYNYSFFLTYKIGELYGLIWRALRAIWARSAHIITYGYYNNIILFIKNKSSKIRMTLKSLNDDNQKIKVIKSSGF